MKTLSGSNVEVIYPAGWIWNPFTSRFDKLFLGGNGKIQILKWTGQPKEDDYVREN